MSAAERPGVIPVPDSIGPKRQVDLIGPIIRESALAESLGELRKLSSGQLIPAAIELAKGIYAEIPETSPLGEYRSSLEAKVVDGEGEDSRQAKIAAALSIHNLSKLDPKSEEWRALVSLVSLEHQITRQILREIIGGENALRFDHVDKTLALAMLDMQDYTDVWFGEYIQRLQGEGLTQEFERLTRSVEDGGEGKTTEEAQQLLKDQLVAQKLATKDTRYLYSIFDKGEKEGEWKATSYRDAFPNSTKWIEARLLALSNDLETVISREEGPAREKAVLVKSYIDAWHSLVESRSTDPYEQHNLGERLDIAWMNLKLGQPGDTGALHFLPIHPMETYEDRALRFRVDPQIVFAMFDDRDPGLFQECGRVKDEMYTILRERHGEMKLFKNAASAIDHTDLGLYVDIGSGTDLTAMVGGITLPNNDEVKIEKGKGVRIVDKLQGADEIWRDAYRPLLLRLFDEDFIEREFPEAEMIRKQVVFNVGAHEAAHVLRDVSTELRIGKEFEEQKADAVALSVMRGVIGKMYPEDRYDQELRYALRMWFARFIRVLGRVKEESSRDYYYSGVVGMNALFDARILRVDDSGQYVYDDRNMERVNDFFERMERVGDQIIKVYDSENIDEAKAYRQRNYRETPETVALMQHMGFIESADDPRLERNRGNSGSEPNDRRVH